MTSIIYILVFNKIAKLPTGGVPELAFYLSGITIWNYFSDTFNKTSSVFKDNAAVMGKVYFPRLIMPLSIVVSGLMRFGIQFLLFCFVVLYYTFIDVKIHPNTWILLLPVLLVIMASLSLGLGMIFSSLTTKYRDLTYLLSFGMQLLMYASPVVYASASMPEKYKWITIVNPLTGIFECFRYGFLGSGSFNPMSLVFSTAITAVILTIGILVFNKVEKSFMDTV
jgi:lipopolysaccharide transport system permease protein